MGGSNPSYTHIEEQMHQEPDGVILTRRMPRDIPVLRDMKHWSRAELESWKAHILAGQRGQIPENNIFAWRILPRPRNEPPKLIEYPTRSLYPGASVRWTPNELLYAQKMRLPVEPPSTLRESTWNELPLARTSHVYAVYTIDLFQALLSLHEKDTALCSLVKEVAQMEQQGPIHVSIVEMRRLQLIESCAFRMPLV
jgi:hypothetical protein